MTEQQAGESARSCRRPRVTRRILAWQFPGTVPSHWFRGSAALTAVLDTFTLVIPDNESYYVRTLRDHARDLTDPPLRDELHAFFQQETLHGKAHRIYWTNLRDDGIDAERFASVVGVLLYSVIERVLPRRLNVANVAAIEHVNAYLAHAFLRRDLLASADPAMRRLFEWHFAEEIEHKSVAFDVLARAHPGYATRAVSGVLVFSLFHILLCAGTTYVLIRRRELLRRKTFSDLWRFWIGEGMLAESLRGMGRYLKPSFHPWAIDDYALAERVLRPLDEEVMPPHAKGAGE